MSGCTRVTIARLHHLDRVWNALLLVVGWESLEAGKRGPKSGFKNLFKVGVEKVLSRHVRSHRAAD